MTPPALIFDLDGTLVDSVYQHVLAWHEALSSVGIELSVWRIHRRIGMSGGMFTRALLRETDIDLDDALLALLQNAHAEAYNRQAHTITPLPGAIDLLARLTTGNHLWAIATSGRLQTAQATLDMLHVPAHIPIITRDRVPYAKPDPDLFLEAARELGVDPVDAAVVGDSVWDLLAAKRARMLGIGLLSGGYGTDELERAGSYRVYNDPAHMLKHLDEIGFR